MPGSVADIKSIFGNALEIQSPAERQVYLDHACAGDPHLRAEVESLLDAKQAAGGFFDPVQLPNSMTTDDLPEQPGGLIGPYKLIEQIGEGGMGTVWMAQQTEPVKRVVALKLIKAGMGSKQFIARFEAERQALALMDHANIARVLDGGTTKGEAGGVGHGRPYFVMDLVKGVPITKYCDEHHLTPRQRLELFIPICQAIQHAHQKGIIHRDLKPSNVLVALYDGKPVPKVIDFGVAKAAGQSLTEKTLVTGFGTIVGTVEYMSPEQAEINQLDIDTRSDIYSLGVLLYELLTGTPPFSRKQLEKVGMLEMLRVIREEEPSKPSTKLSTAEGLPALAANRGTEPAKLTKQLRGELDWIVMKALEKDRNRRYDTANGFAMDVQRFLADEAVLACPPSTAYRLRKFVRRNKGPVLAGSLVLAALMIGIVGTTWGLIRATHAEANAVREAGEKTVALGEKETALATAKANELEAHRQGTLAKEQALLARRRFYAAQGNLAQQALEAEQSARALDLLESQRPKLDQEDLRGFDWYYLWRVCNRNLHRTLSGPKGEAVWALAITPDGKAVVSGSGDGGVRVWDVATGKERAILSGHKRQIWRLAISPDGDMVASASKDHTAKLWDLGTSELLATLPTGASIRSVDFSPDGKVLALGTEDGALELWDVGTRRQRLTLPAHAAPTIALAYSADGKMLVSGCAWETTRGPASVKVWDVTSDQPRIAFQLARAAFAAFSPDSKLLATSDNSGVKVWDVPSCELKANLGTRVQSVAFSADGNTLVLGCEDRTVKLWEFADGVMRTIGVHLGAVNAVAIVPQSDLLASGSNDGTVKVWHVGLPQEAAKFASKSTIRSLAFTPDSKLLVVGSDTTTTVLDAATGQETATLPVSGVLAASADANLLAAWRPDHTQVIWDIAAARARAELSVGPRPAGAAFSRDGKALVTWIWDSDLPRRAVRLWDVATSHVRLMGKENIHCAAFSPDGRTLATGNQFGGVMLWDATTGQQSTTLQYYESPNRGAKAVAFSNDGKLLAAGNNEGMLRLWDAETGQLMMSFKGHTDTINSLAFSPDDKTLLSGSHDRTARLWDVVTGQELLTLKQHKSSVTLVSFAPDGKRLATSSGAEMKLWLAATDPEATAIRVELDPDDPDSPRAANNWGDRLQGVHRPGEAEIAYRKALGRLETLDATLPGTTEYRHELAYCLLGLSLVADLQPAAAQSERRFVEIWQIFSADHRLRFSERLLDCGEKRRGAGHFQEAVNVISKAIELTPDFDYAYHHRAHVYEDLKEWDRAWADFSEAIRISPMQSAHYACRARSFELRLPEAGARDHTGLVERTNFTLAWYNLALFKLQRGDHAGYRAVCSGMLEHLDQSVSVDDLFWIIWTCVLAPDGVADWTIPLKLAEKAHTDDRTSYDKLNHLGAMLYRAGRFQEATQRLTEAKAAFQHTSGTRSTIVYNWFFQAMAQHRLGHTTEAASWLKKAVEKIDMPSPKADQDPLEMTWNGHLTLQLLRREVEELLKEAPNDVEEKPSDDPDA